GWGTSWSGRRYTESTGSDKGRPKSRRRPTRTSRPEFKAGRHLALATPLAMAAQPEAAQAEAAVVAQGAPKSVLARRGPISTPVRQAPCSGRRTHSGGGTPYEGREDAHGRGLCHRDGDRHRRAGRGAVRHR